MPQPMIRSATPADMPQIVDTLTAAFMSDPILGWMAREGAARQSALRALFTLMVAEAKRDTLWIDIANDGAGVAVWIKPGYPSSATGLRAQIALLPRFLAVSGLARIVRALAVGQMMDRIHPHAPHAYLQFLACHPDHQGQGLGSALLAHRLTQTDDLGLSAYLETGTERNVTLYLRHGFAVTGEDRPMKAGPNCWSMWRELPERG